MDSIFEHHSIFSDGEVMKKDAAGNESATPHYPGHDEIELFGFTYDTQRETLGHSVNQLVAFASIRHSDVILIIQNSTYSPILEQYMNSGRLLYEVALRRSGFIDGTNLTLERRVFRDCYITRFIQILDFLVLHVRILAKEETSFMYAQGAVYKDGQLASNHQGMSVSAVDFRLGLSGHDHSPS
ncbi:MAG: hypothetical protein LBJ89_03450 [Holosporales bacterium]|nr:hypothetical protein [Holosporales bacterium]